MARLFRDDGRPGHRSGTGTRRLLTPRPTVTARVTAAVARARLRGLRALRSGARPRRPRHGLLIGRLPPTGACCVAPPLGRQPIGSAASGAGSRAAERAGVLSGGRRGSAPITSCSASGAQNPVPTSAAAPRPPARLDSSRWGGAGRAGGAGVGASGWQPFGDEPATWRRGSERGKDAPASLPARPGRTSPPPRGCR